MTCTKPWLDRLAGDTSLFFFCLFSSSLWGGCHRANNSAATATRPGVCPPSVGPDIRRSRGDGPSIYRHVARGYLVVRGGLGHLHRICAACCVSHCVSAPLRGSLRYWSSRVFSLQHFRCFPCFCWVRWPCCC